MFYPKNVSYYSSNDGTNFTEVTAKLTSSGNIVGFEDFTLNPYQKVRYVRILGYGNSENSGWNSYEEVEIHGDNTCASLSVIEQTLNQNELLIYPVPVSQGQITIQSNNGLIGTAKIFDIQGKLLLTKTIEENTSVIDVSAFSKGIYIVSLFNELGQVLGTKKLIIED